jgi:hypothetical protein
LPWNISFTRETSVKMVSPITKQPESIMKMLLMTMITCLELKIIKKILMKRQNKQMLSQMNQSFTILSQTDRKISLMSLMESICIIKMKMEAMFIKLKLLSVYGTSQKQEL